MAGTGGADHIFLQHGTADIFDAIAQTDLCDLGSLSHPGGLKIFDIIEKEAGDSHRPQMIVASRFETVPARGIGPQISCVGLKIPADKSGKTAGLVLLLAEADQRIGRQQSFMMLRSRFTMSCANRLTNTGN